MPEREWLRFGDLQGSGRDFVIRVVRHLYASAISFLTVIWLLESLKCRYCFFLPNYMCLL
jgi:hypothetical protein